MSEIKIRIWDMDRKVMLGIQYVIFYNGDFYENYRDLEDGIPIENIVVMQYTGLDDKNGLGIYEGDIISELSEQVEDWEKHILAEVVWHKAGFYGKEKGHEPEYPITEFTQGEVIGNIYENPELLEESK